MITPGSRPAGEYPPLCHYVIGFTADRLIAEDSFNPMGTFLHDFLITDKRKDMKSALMATLLSSAVLYEHTSMLLGIAADRQLDAPAEWFQLIHSVPKNKNLYGLPLPSCCGTKVALKDRSCKVWFLKCTGKCKKRTPNYVPPTEATVPGMGHGYIWRWPLSEQTWTWLEPQPRADASHIGFPTEVLRF